MELRGKVRGRMRKFYEVDKKFKKYPSEATRLPERMTAGSAGYDFYSKSSVSVEPGETVKLWTDVKADMNPDEALILVVRSSLGGKFMLANTVGVIDSDYFSNPNNDGNIGIFLKNISSEKQWVHAGDRIAQGVFVKYLTAENGNNGCQRSGGFGSTKN